jgi:hypothetical protein
MSERDPARLFEDPSASEALRAALDAAQQDLPSEAELASLAARLGPLLPPPGGGGAADPSPAIGASSSGAVAKTLAVLAAAAAVSGIVWWGAAERDVRPEPRAEPVIEPAEPPREEEALPEGLDVPEELAREETARPRTRPAPPRFESDPEAELALIREAQDALRTSPARALALTDEHRRRFGDGALAQEREVVAIDALVRLGRRAEARARAAELHRRWPRSAHGRRVDVLVGAPD